MKSFFKIISQNIAIILLVLGIVVAVNVLSNKFPERWDFTDEKEYTLSDSTKKVLTRLKDRLTIRLFYSKDLPPILLPIKDRVADLLEEFKAYAKQDVIIESIDPDINEEKEREAISLGVVPLELNVIEKDRREVKKVFMGMVIYYEDKKQVIPVVAQVKNLEYLLDLAILKLTQKDLPKIGVYIGSEQKKYRLIPQIIREMGQMVEVTPETKDLDEKDLSVFLVLDPVDVDKRFLKQWDAVLKKGTNVLVFSGNVSVNGDLKAEGVHSGLDDWLAEKGIGISDKLLVDPRQNAQAGFMSGFVRVYMAYPFWVKVFKKQLDTENPVTAGLEELLFPWSNIITVMDHKEKNWELTELIHSSPYSFLQPEEIPNVDPQYINQMRQLPVMEPLPLSVILKKVDSEKQGKIFVTATHHILQDQFLQQYQSNVLFLANLIEFSSWGDYLIGIRSRGKTSRPLADLSQSEKSFIKWGLMIGVPAFAIISGLLGLLVMKRRRASLISKI